MILSVIISAVVILIVMYSMNKKGQTPLNLILRSSEKKKDEEEPEQKVEKKEKPKEEKDRVEPEKNEKPGQCNIVVKNKLKNNDYGMDNLLDFIRTKLKPQLDNLEKILPDDKFKKQITENINTMNEEYGESKDFPVDNDSLLESTCKFLSNILGFIIENMPKEDKTNRYKNEDAARTYLSSVEGWKDKLSPETTGVGQFALYHDIDTDLDNNLLMNIFEKQTPMIENEEKENEPESELRAGEDDNNPPNPLFGNPTPSGGGNVLSIALENVDISNMFTEDNTIINEKFITITVPSTTQTFTYSLFNLLTFSQQMFPKIIQDPAFVKSKTGDKFKELFFSRYFTQYLGLITSQNNFLDNHKSNKKTNWYFKDKNLITVTNGTVTHDFVSYFTRLLDAFIEQNPSQFKKEDADQSEEVQQLKADLEVANEKVSELDAQIEANNHKVVGLTALNGELKKFNTELGEDEKKLKLKTDAKVAELEEQLQAQAKVIEKQQKEQADKIAEDNQLNTALDSNQALQKQLSDLKLTEEEKEKTLKTLQDNLIAENTQLENQLKVSQKKVEEKAKAIEIATSKSNDNCVDELTILTATNGRNVVELKQTKKDLNELKQAKQIYEGNKIKEIEETTKQCNLEKEALNNKIQKQDRTIFEINEKINELQKKQFDEFTCMFGRAFQIDKELKGLDENNENKAKLQSELTQIIENIGKAYKAKFGSEFGESKDIPNIFTDLIEQIKPYMSLEDSSTPQPPTMNEECFSCLTRRIDDEANRLGYERILKKLGEIGEKNKVLVKENNSLQTKIADFDKVEKERMNALQALSKDPTINEGVMGIISEKLEKLIKEGSDDQPQPQYDAFTILLDLLNEVMGNASDTSNMKRFLQDQAKKLVTKHQETQRIIDNGFASNTEGTCSNPDSTTIKQLEAEITKLQTELDKCTTEKARVEADAKARAEEAEAKSKAEEAEAKSKAEEAEAKSKAEADANRIINILNPIKRQIYAIVTEYFPKFNTDNNVKASYEKYAESNKSTLFVRKITNSVKKNTNTYLPPVFENVNNFLSLLDYLVSNNVIVKENGDLEVVSTFIEGEIQEDIQNKEFKKQVTILYGYLTNPFQIMIGVTDLSNIDSSSLDISSKKGSNIGKVEALICSNDNTTDSNNKNIKESSCIYKDVRLNNQTYTFDNIYLPKNNEIQYKTSNEKSTSLHEVDEIDSLLTRFQTESGKNFMLMHYGYSGTGKTYVAKKIHERLIKDSSAELIEERHTYGKKGTIENSRFSLIPFSFNTRITNDYSGENIINNFGTDGGEYLNGEPDIYLRNSKLIKTSLNNKDSSRFHLCRVYKNKEKKNTLYFFDLAGVEDPVSIIKSDLQNLTESQIENSFSNQIQQVPQPISDIYSNVSKKAANTPINIKEEYTDHIWFKYIESSFRYIARNNNNQMRTIIVQDPKEKTIVKDKLDLLFESYFIRHSLLNKLQPKLTNINNTTITDKAIQIDEIGLYEKLGNQKIESIQSEITKLKNVNEQLNDNIKRLKQNTEKQEFTKKQHLILSNEKNINEKQQQLDKIIKTNKYEKKPIKFDKIIMYGFVRNDIGYRDGDQTFLNGTIKTLDFLQSLQPGENPPTNQLNKGGTIIKIPQQSEKTENLLTKIFMKKAGAFAESGYQSAFVKPFQSQSGGGETGGTSGQDGGGILDKSVIDTDRALFIAVTFVISLVVMHVKKVLYNKEILHNRRHTLYVMLGIFFTMMMVFKVIVSMETIDTMYMLLYLLMFSIVNVAVNMFQMDVKTTQSLNKAVNQIEDELNMNMISPTEHVDEDIQRENKYDSNMLLSWAITSVGVIFV
jgi:hypothetical protein